MYRPVDINCDMGEGMGNEELLMPFISSANIACGFHAGDADTIRTVIRLCLQHDVHIGAHPSFMDRANFGRSAINLPGSEIYQLVMQQLIFIDGIAKEFNAKLHHVKPHGALYNMAAKDAGVAKAIVSGVKDFDDSLIYFGLSGSVMIVEAKKLGLQTANEVFADRTYQSDGSLTPRSNDDALIRDVESVVRQVSMVINKGKVIATNGQEVFLNVDTICIHGDGEHVVEFAQAIHKNFNEE